MCSFGIRRTIWCKNVALKPIERHVIVTCQPQPSTVVFHVCKILTKIVCGSIRLKQTSHNELLFEDELYYKKMATATTMTAGALWHTKQSKTKRNEKLRNQPELESSKLLFGVWSNNVFDYCRKYSNWLWIDVDG